MKAATFPPEESWILYPDATPEAIEAKAPFVDNGSSLITPERYYDPAFMAREWEHLWTRTWLLAGRESDLQAVGSFFTFDIGPESIIVVRATAWTAHCNRLRMKRRSAPRSCVIDPACRRCGARPGAGSCS